MCIWTYFIVADSVPMRVLGKWCLSAWAIIRSDMTHRRNEVTPYVRKL